MASKPTIRDSSITEQQLAPHLRRRSGGGRTYSTSVSAASGTTTLASYTGTGETVDIESWDWAFVELTAATAIVASAEVTETDPWTFQAASDRSVTVSVTGSLSLQGCGTGAMLAILRDGVDVAVGVSPLVWSGTVLTGSALTVEARASATACSETLTVGAVTISVVG